MDISGIINTVNSYAVNDDSLSIKKAVKAYMDEKLTGLTDEEKEEIERRKKEYLDKKPIKSEQDRNIFNNFIKSLLKEFGYKGDIEEYAESLTIELHDKFENFKKQPAQINITEHYHKAAAGAMVVKNKFFS